MLRARPRRREGHVTCDVVRTQAWADDVLQTLRRLGEAASEGLQRQARHIARLGVPRVLQLSVNGLLGPMHASRVDAPGGPHKILLRLVALALRCALEGKHGPHRDEAAVLGGLAKVEVGVKTRRLLRIAAFLPFQLAESGPRLLRDDIGAATRTEGRGGSCGGMRVLLWRDPNLRCVRRRSRSHRRASRWRTSAAAGPSPSPQTRAGKCGGR